MTATATGSTTPTADQPELGCISQGGVQLSQVAYWVEGDEHVFRSTEYDVLGADEDFGAAIVKFVENSEDYATFIADLLRQETAIDEAEVALVLVRRFADAYRQQRDAARQDARRIIRIPRKRPGSHALGGYRRSPHKKSSQPSHA